MDVMIPSGETSSFFYQHTAEEAQRRPQVHPLRREYLQHQCEERGEGKVLEARSTFFATLSRIHRSVVGKAVYWHEEGVCLRESLTGR